MYPLPGVLRSVKVHVRLCYMPDVRVPCLNTFLLTCMYGTQGRRRAFKSGLADETIEYPRRKTLESSRKGRSLLLWGGMAVSFKNVLNLERLYVRFNAFFNEFGTRFHFFSKDISRARNRVLDIPVTFFRQSRLELQVSFTLFHLHSVVISK